VLSLIGSASPDQFRILIGLASPGEGCASGDPGSECSRVLICFYFASAEEVYRAFIGAEKLFITSIDNGRV